MRALDLLFVAALMIGGTLWLAFIMSAPGQLRSQAAVPYAGPDLSRTSTEVASRNG